MRPILAVLVLSLIATGPVAASNKHWHDDEQHGNKHKQSNDHARDHDGERPGNCYFQPRDVQIIREYYEPRHQSLPPGLEKKYRRTGQLPPGWQKKMQPLPVEVERRLVVLPAGYRRGYIDGTVVVYAPHTQVIIDVVKIFGQ